MKRTMIYAIAAALFVCLSSTVTDQGQAALHTTGVFGSEHCPPAGDAKADPADDPFDDPYLNSLKNRDVAPSSYVPMTLAAIIADVPAAGAGKRRDRWTAEERAAVEAKETQGIAVVGYLAGVHREGAESCNCHDADHRDYHMWLVASPHDALAKAMVIEISPRLAAAHPSWPALAAKAWRDGTLLRVSGWLTWDQEHPGQLSEHKADDGRTLPATRGTLWEVHPIHAIEVKDSHGVWVAIDSTATAR
ncbi:MAG TPA: hypothetical protein VLC46_16525 [Thermoanaerobaculia bacterium]|jgi:hypothetical protein|nr:hypothetical protein [Thermoanaerobaculia bacterium]